MRKQKNPKFSYEAWAKELGEQDKSYIRMIVLGKRPINDRMSEEFARNLELSTEEQIYFFTLIEYSQSKTRKQKELFGKKLIDLLKHEIDQLEIKSHYEFLSDPNLPRLQVLLSLKDLNQDLKKISWILKITEDQVRISIEKLIELNLVEKINNQYVTLKKSFKVPDQFGNLGLANFYNESLDFAKNAISLPSEERNYKCLLLPLNKEEIAELTKNIQHFSIEQLTRFNPEEFADRKLYQVHLHIIPVSDELPQNTILENMGQI